MSFAQSGELRTELYIDREERVKNETAFDALLAQKGTIEKEFGEPLRWERLDTRRACRIACLLYTSTPCCNEPLKISMRSFFSGGRRWSAFQLVGYSPRLKRFQW